MSKFSAIIYILNNISILKTLWVNYKVLGLRNMKKISIVVGKNVDIRNLGKIIITDSNARIHLGSSLLFNTSSKNILIFNNRGTIVFGGDVIIQPGAVLYTSKNGIIEFCGNNKVGRDTQILSRKRISIGLQTEFSWMCQVSDTDFHYIENMTNGLINPNSKEIIIGAQVWIGNHVIIGKGSFIADNCIVGQHSYVNKRYEINNKIIVGSPAKQLNGEYRRIFDLDKENQLNHEAEDGCSN